MKVNKVVAIPITVVYNMLLESVWHDIKAHVKAKKMPAELSSGYCYRKTLTTQTGGKRDVDVELVALIPDETYHVAFHSLEGTHHLAYRLHPVATMNTHIEYQEWYDDKHFLGRMNYNLVSLLYHRRQVKRISELLMGLEDEYLKGEQHG